MWALFAQAKAVLLASSNAVADPGWHLVRMSLPRFDRQEGLAPPSRCRSPAVLGVRAGVQESCWRRRCLRELGPLLKTHSHPDFTPLLHHTPNPQGLMF